MIDVTKMMKEVMENKKTIRCFEMSEEVTRGVQEKTMEEIESVGKGYYEDGLFGRDSFRGYFDPDNEKDPINVWISKKHKIVCGKIFVCKVINGTVCDLTEEDIEYLEKGYGIRKN